MRVATLDCFSFFQVIEVSQLSSQCQAAVHVATQLRAENALKSGALVRARQEKASALEALAGKKKEADRAAARAAGVAHRAHQRRLTQQSALLVLSLRRLYARAALQGDAKAQHVRALNRIFGAFATSQVVS